MRVGSGMGRWSRLLRRAGRRESGATFDEVDVTGFIGVGLTVWVIGPRALLGQRSLHDARSLLVERGYRS